MLRPRFPKSATNKYAYQQACGFWAVSAAAMISNFLTPWIPTKKDKIVNLELP